MTSTPTKPVDKVVIATKGLQDRNINIIAGTTVENKGKLILTVYYCLQEFYKTYYVITLNTNLDFLGSFFVIHFENVLNGLGHKQDPSSLLRIIIELFVGLLKCG